MKQPQSLKRLFSALMQILKLSTPQTPNWGATILLFSLDFKSPIWGFRGLSNKKGCTITIQPSEYIIE